MHNPLVSVIIPVYNGERVLDRCIGSILEQTYDRWEIIIVNDGSRDRSKETIRKYLDCGAIKYYENETNMGIPYSRNKAIEKSQGKYISFIDQDDEWMPKKIEEQVKFFGSSSLRLGAVGTGVVLIDKNGKVQETKYGKDIPLQRKNRMAYILSKSAIITTSSMVRRDCFDEVGPLDTSRYGCDDLKIWMEIADKWPIKNINKPLAKKRVHDNNASESIRQYIDRVRTQSELVSRFECLSEVASKSIAHKYYLLASKLFKTGRAKMSQKFVTKSIRLNPFYIKSYALLLACTISYYLYRTKL